MARVSIFLITVALMAGMVGCIFVQYDLIVCSTEGGQVTAPGEATFTYGKGTVVNLVAQTQEGYRFINWIGDVGAIDNINAATTIITMDGDYSIVANFAPEIWEVRDWHDLDAVRNNLDGRYILTDDLDSATAGYMGLASDTANQGQGWQPIGISDDQFTGTFDGQGYEIHDLYINHPAEDYVGLFGEVGQEGVTKGIGVVNATVIGNDYVGGLVGHTEGSVSNCYSSGNVTGEEYIGSLVGHNGGMVNNSYSSGSVTGDSRVGGLVGWNQATLTDSYSSCIVTGNWSIGGLVGDNWYYGGSVSNSYSTGSVTGDSRVGGLVGVNYYGNVTDSYSIGSVTGSSQVGGLVGYNRGTVSNSFWDTVSSGMEESDGGTGRTSAEMKSITTFSGAAWDIITVANPSKRNPTYAWNIVNGVTYPFLSWQPV